MVFLDGSNIKKHTKVDVLLIKENRIEVFTLTNLFMEKTSMQGLIEKKKGSLNSPAEIHKLSEQNDVIMIKAFRLHGIFWHYFSFSNPIGILCPHRNHECMFRLFSRHWYVYI